MIPGVRSPTQTLCLWGYDITAHKLWRLGCWGWSQPLYFSSLDPSMVGPALLFVWPSVHSAHPSAGKGNETLPGNMLVEDALKWLHSLSWDWGTLLLPIGCRGGWEMWSSSTYCKKGVWMLVDKSLYHEHKQKWKSNSNIRKQYQKCKGSAHQVPVDSINDNTCWLQEIPSRSTKWNPS